LASFFPAGPQGDYVYSQADLDRVVSQLMEQHQGNAPPPAPKEVIEALPRVNVTEQMVIEGTDCAVCKDDLVIEEEVCQLPCKHIYHFDCVSKWLEEHDVSCSRHRSRFVGYVLTAYQTCPVCRHPVTPEDKQAEQREAQAANQRQRAAANPIMSWAFGRSGVASTGATPSNTTPRTQGPGESSNTQSTASNSQQPQPSNNNRSSGGGGFAGLFRRRGSS
jgi:hypothetical protein